jgi:enoyl-CoA hydratase
MSNDPTFESVRISIDDDGIAEVLLRATGKSPRMGPSFWNEFAQVFRWLNDEPRVRVVLLRGEGPNFSTGLDLQAMASEVAPLVGPAVATERYALYALIQRMQGAIDAVAACKKPVIAAIAGQLPRRRRGLDHRVRRSSVRRRRDLLGARSAARDGG